MSSGAARGFVEMREDFLDHHRGFDASDDLCGGATGVVLIANEQCLFLVPGFESNTRELALAVCS